MMDLPTIVNLCLSLEVSPTTDLAGLKITASQRTMSGQNEYLSGPKFRFGGHFDRSRTRPSDY